MARPPNQGRPPSGEEGPFPPDQRLIPNTWHRHQSTSGHSSTTGQFNVPPDGATSESEVPPLASRYRFRCRCRGHLEQVATTRRPPNAHWPATPRRVMAQGRGEITSRPKQQTECANLSLLNEKSVVVSGGWDIGVITCRNHRALSSIRYK